MHPVVYSVVFACDCGEEHIGLITESELDWEPLGLEPGRTFVNLMTSRHDDLSTDLRAIALTRIEAGEWPWSFFCYLEERARPVTPSSFVRLAPGAELRSENLGLAVRCPVCGSVSINVVSEPHVDLPFWNDPHIGVVEHVFGDDALGPSMPFGRSCTPRGSTSVASHSGKCALSRCSLPGGIIPAASALDQEGVTSCGSDLTPRPRAPIEHLLRHCLEQNAPSEQRRPVQTRLEEVLGPEFARRLVTALTFGSRNS